jgi:hypothetical protein
MDALKIDKAILAGFDWGARTVNIVSALWLRSCDEVWTRTAHDAVTAMTECPILGWR